VRAVPGQMLGSARGFVDVTTATRSRRSTNQDVLRERVREQPSFVKEEPDNCGGSPRPNAPHRSIANLERVQQKNDKVGKIRVRGRNCKKAPDSVRRSGVLGSKTGFRLTGRRSAEIRMKKRADALRSPMLNSADWRRAKFYLKAGIVEGRPTRMKNRANA
jgi:hypothetical protein